MRSTLNASFKTKYKSTRMTLTQQYFCPIGKNNGTSPIGKYTGIGENPWNWENLSHSLHIGKLVYLIFCSLLL